MILSLYIVGNYLKQSPRELFNLQSSVFRVLRSVLSDVDSFESGYKTISCINGNVGYERK